MSRTPDEGVAGRAPRPLSILHVSVVVGEFTAQYNEHCLPVAKERDITICSFFPATLAPVPEITLFEGDGTILGFLKTLKRAFGHRSYDAVHVHAPQTAAMLLLANLWMRRLMKNGVLTIHNSLYNFRLKNQVLLFPTAFFFREVVFCSHAALDSIPRPLRRLLGNKVSVIQNGVDTDRVDATLAKLNGHGSDPGFTVVSAGRLIPRKNAQTLLHAFDRLDDSRSRLVHVGDGESRESVTSEAHDLGLGDRVRFTGSVEREKVYEHLAQADVFVSASRGEGLPVAVLEAMAAGRPVILSDIPPHREIAQGDDLIPLVAPDDADGFSREIRRYERMDSRQRCEIGSRCRMVVENRFSLHAMHRQYEAIYRRLGESVDSKHSGWATGGGSV